MPIENPVKLRGHHLSLFAQYYFEHRNSSKTNVNENGNADTRVRGKHKLTDLLEGKEIFSQSGKSVSYDSDYVSRNYSPAIKYYRISLWQRLIDKPETDVRFVEGFDDLCMFSGGKKCPRYEEKPCGSEGYIDDCLTLAELDLELNKPYRSGDIIVRFEKYRKQTGFTSPKQRFLALLTLFPAKDEDDLSDEEIDRIMNGGSE